MISCVVPCYEMAGRGVEMLRELIASIRMQTFTNYEIIIVDGSEGREISAWCEANAVNCLQYQGSVGAKFNYGIDHASGDIIKPMCQDDKFMEPDTLQKTADAFAVQTLWEGDWSEYPAELYISQSRAEWIACTSHNAGEPQFHEYDHVPYPHRSLHDLRTGENTYGSPSAMAWRRNDLRFDENLKWLLDCEFYSRMAERYGVPTFIDTKVYIRQWSGQATHQIGGHDRIMDTNEVIEKYRDRGGMERTV